MNLDDFDALSFDCYGTLVDWETGIVRALRWVFARSAEAWSDEQLLTSYGRHEAAVEAAAGSHRPYRAVLGEVTGALASDLGVKLTGSELGVLARSLPNWPVFDDTVPALQSLGRRYRLAVLSNVDDDLFAASQQRLETQFDWVVTAQQVGSYKPSQRNFEALVDAVSVPPERLLHVAQSLYHDIAPARRHGLSTVWVNRRAGVAGSGATPPSQARADLEVPDLQTLVRLAGL